MPPMPDVFMATVTVECTPGGAGVCHPAYPVLFSTNVLRACHAVAQLNLLVTLPENDFAAVHGTPAVGLLVLQYNLDRAAYMPLEWCLVRCSPPVEGRTGLRVLRLGHPVLKLLVKLFKLRQRGGRVPPPALVGYGELCDMADPGWWLSLCPPPPVVCWSTQAQPPPWVGGGTTAATEETDLQKPVHCDPDEPAGFRCRARVVWDTFQAVWVPKD
jgi:hypothetical protein